ncbi:PEP-CTERM sorting domain-containing protein [Oxalobacteraceae bacterium]|nr:PEP-CTERM sorting domain-containing protein [Oxalobacteraceae bacterium]
MNKLIQSLLMSIALAATSVAAHAAVDLSAPASDLSAQLADASSADFGQTISLANAGQAGAGNNFFIDNYTFTLTASNDLSALMTSLIAAPNTGLTITGFNLLSGANVVLAGHQDTTNFSVLDQAWAFDSGLLPLAAGNYTLQVSGYVANAEGGSYSGNIAIAAVPEPEAFALLLAGLGIVGFAARRRKLAVAA